jgi:predicted RNase H-like nuclease (RuvC/YqgF family)
MDTYETLIKIRDSELDAQRQLLSDLADKEMMIENEIKNKAQQMRDEADKAEKDIESQSALTKFLNRSRGEIKELRLNANKLRKRINVENDKLYNLFADKKRITILRDANIEKKEKEIEALENQELNDLVISRYRHAIFDS